MLSKTKVIFIGILILLLALSACSESLYTIQTEINSGEGKIELEPEQDDYESGTKVKVKAKPDDGYQFKEWTAGLSEEKDSSGTIIVDGDINLVAEFERKEYTVVFEDYDGEELKEEKVEHEASAMPPDEPTREGYEFTGWDKDYTEVTEDLTITAEYEEKSFDEINVAGTVEFDYDIDYSDEVSFSSSNLATTEDTTTSETNKVIAGEKLIKFKSDVSQAEKEAIVAELEGEIINQIDNLDLVLIELDEEKEISVSDYEEIEYVEANHRIRSSNHYTFTPENIYHEWNHKQINLDHLTSNAEDKVVAVLDTGIDYEHPDLEGVVNRDLGKNFTEDGADDETMDYNGHGTHVAGIAGLTGSEIIPVKVLGDDGSGGTSEIIAGIDYVIEEEIADVINLSLGLNEDYEPSDNDPLEEVINNAYDTGIKLVASAGNDGEEDNVGYPAKYENVIAIGSVNYSGVKADHSDYGAGLDFMAPGKAIYSTHLDDDHKYLTGTSMAAPHAASLVSLLLANGVSQSKIRTKLADTAMDIGSSTEYGNGLINASWAENNVEKIKIVIGELVNDDSEIDVVEESTIATDEAEFSLEDVNADGEYRVFAWVDTKDNQEIEAGDYFAKSEMIDFSTDEDQTGIELILEQE